MERSSAHVSLDVIYPPPDRSWDSAPPTPEPQCARAPVPPVSLAACLALGSIGLLIIGVMPLLLGELVAEGRITGEAAGSLVTVELLAIAAGSVAGLRMLGGLRAKLVVAAGGAVVLAANLLALTSMSWLLLACGRGAAGFGEGILIAPATVAIARLQRPERAAAAYLAVQTLLQFLVAAVTPRLVWQGSLAKGAMLLLGASGCVAMALAVFLPATLRPTTHEEGHGPIPGRGFAALLCAGLFQGAITATWGYFAIVLSVWGYPSTDQASMVALSLAAQITGALIAMGTGAPRSNRAMLMAGSCCMAMLVVNLMLFGTHHVVAWSFSALFGFLWLYTSPMLTGLLVQVDPQRRAVMYQAPSQLAGAALMPLCAGAVVASAGLKGALGVGVAGFLAAALLAGSLKTR